MCISPVNLPNGSQVACRRCSLCRDNRVNDLIGRCVAESYTASAVFAVTLTYKGDGAETVVLRYADVQKMLKRLRRDGFKVRYICAGEYGSLKGRAHWHIVLFFNGPVPKKPQENKRAEWEYWPHGLTFWQVPDWGGFKYLLKYVLKDQKSEATSGQFALSKIPPLGAAFFDKLADDLVDRGMVLHDPSYSFMDVRKRDGTCRVFWLQGVMRERLLIRYWSRWMDKYGEEPRWSEWVTERMLDPLYKQRSDTFKKLRAEVDAKRNPRPWIEPLLRPDNRAEAQVFIPAYGRDAGNYFMLAHEDYSYTCITKEGTSCRLWKEGFAWTLTRGDAVSVAMQLAEAKLPFWNGAPVWEWLVKNDMITNQSWNPTTREIEAATRAGGSPSRSIASL